MQDAYFHGSDWACGSSEADQDWGPPTWGLQNKGASEFDRCRGFDGENRNFKNVHGSYICVESDHDAGGK